MNSKVNGKATFVEVFGSIKFPARSNTAPARPWPRVGFAVNRSTHVGEAQLEEAKLVRSCN